MRAIRYGGISVRGGIDMDDGLYSSGPLQRYSQGVYEKKIINLLSSFGRCIFGTVKTM